MDKSIFGALQLKTAINGAALLVFSTGCACAAPHAASTLTGKDTGKAPATLSRRIASSGDASIIATPSSLVTLTVEQAQQSNADVKEGQIAFVIGRWDAAEADFRHAVQMNPANPDALVGLAKTLEVEGKNAQSISVYRYLLNPKPHWGTSLEGDPVLRMHFCLLLAGDGQWAEAMSVYNNTLARVSLGPSFPAITVPFNPDAPNLTFFQTMVHLRLGIVYSGMAENAQAFSEYQTAHNLQPEMAVTNYYYGTGWQQLNPKDKATIGNAAQAKAALEKASKMGIHDTR